MPQQIENPEAGLRNHRVEFIRETDTGVTPSDPTIEKYSDAVSNVAWSSDATNEARRGLGSADPKGFVRGPETHELTVEYDLVKWLIDGSGEPNDAAADGVFRDDDQLLENSHTFLSREDKGQIGAESTVSGSTGYSTRIYTVGRGGLVDEAVLAGDPSDSQPISVELSYVFGKVRSYQIDQPDSSTFLAAKSSDSADAATLTVEGEDSTGSYATEDITIDGTNLVSSTTEFQSIDAAYLSAEQQGDITIFLNDGDETAPTEGDALMKIYGKASYDGVDGDIGVPGKGSSGTRNSISGDVVTFLGDTIQRDSSPVPHEIQSMTVTVSNNVETTERTSEAAMAVFPANRNIMVEATMYGESATHHLLKDHLQNNSKSITWQMDDGDIELQNAVLTGPGERAAESGQAVMTTDNEFTADGINVTSN